MTTATPSSRRSSVHQRRRPCAASSCVDADAVAACSSAAVHGSDWCARPTASVSASHRSPVQISRARCSSRRATISRSSSRGAELRAGEPARRTPRSCARWARPRPTTRRRRRSVVATTGDDRRPPGVVGEIGEVEHLLEVAAGLVDALAVGLVDHEDVGDLHQPGLVGLHRVAPAGVDHDDGRVGLAGDLDLDLADADRLDDDPRGDRPRRAAGPPRASPATARRDDRASPSSG